MKNKKHTLQENYERLFNTKLTEVKDVTALTKGDVVWAKKDGRKLTIVSRVDSVMYVAKDAKGKEVNINLVGISMTEPKLIESRVSEEEQFADRYYDGADGWDDGSFTASGLLDAISAASRLGYEISNARRESHALRGEDKDDVIGYIDDVIEMLKDARWNIDQA